MQHGFGDKLFINYCCASKYYPFERHLFDTVTTFFLPWRVFGLSKSAQGVRYSSSRGNYGNSIMYSSSLLKTKHHETFRQDAPILRVGLLP